MIQRAQGHTQITTKSSGPGGAHIGGFGRSLILMGPNDEKGGSGGGAGGKPGQGGAGGDDGGEGTTLSDSAKGEVAKMINEAVTGAITNHTKRLQKQLTDDMSKSINDALGPIGEQLKALSESGNQGGNKGKGGEGGGGNSGEMEKVMSRYEGRIKELEQANKQEREAREAEKATRLREEERSLLSQTLRTKGLTDVSAKAVVALLHSEEKKVARTEDGRIVFRMEKGKGAAAYVDELDLETGVDEWLKTEEGKSFIPARQVNGSGGQPARGQGTQGGDKRANAINVLAGALLGGGGGNQ